MLDSDIIIDFLRNREDAVKKVSSLKEKNMKIYTTVFNYQENPKCKEWFYIVTDRHQLSKYKKYHLAFTRTEIKEKLEELFK